LRFAGNNSYAYGAECGRSSPSVYAYIRQPDGSLSRIDNRMPVPVATGNQLWCPHLAAADTQNHIAIAMVPSTGNAEPAGPYQLATYTQDEDGTLTTSSTSDNMP